MWIFCRHSLNMLKPSLSNSKRMSLCKIKHAFTINYNTIYSEATCDFLFLSICQVTIMNLCSDSHRHRPIEDRDGATQCQDIRCGGADRVHCGGFPGPCSFPQGRRGVPKPTVGWHQLHQGL